MVVVFLFGVSVIVNFEFGLVLVKLFLTDLVSELGAGLGHEVGVNPGVEAAAGINAEGVTLLRTRASQHGDQPLVMMYKCVHFIFLEL